MLDTKNIFFLHLSQMNAHSLRSVDVSNNTIMHMNHNDLKPVIKKFSNLI